MRIPRFFPPIAVPVAVLVAVLVAVGCSTARAPHHGYFAVRAIDEASGRGVPMVELRTVHDVVYVTDSAGFAAIHEPGLMGRRVWFHVRSHGYQHPADGFGYRGFAAVLEPGGSITVRIRRLNVAERLYRVTGHGIYRDSVLLGEPVPIRRPLLAGGVVGQDSVVNAVYRGRLYWFWGDTDRAAYPLGNFAVSGAVSAVPEHGGLDPARGVDLDYFVDRGRGGEAFSRKMCPIDGPGPVWIYGLMVLEHEGRERMVCHYARMKDLGHRHEHGVAIWNDATATFEKAREFPLDAPLHPSGHPVRAADDAGVEWFWFADPFPAVRVRAALDEIMEPARYEAFTCLRAGSRWDARRPPLERDATGRLVWGWKADTATVSPQRFSELVARGLSRRDEGAWNLTDIETGEPVQAHRGSVCWNAYRSRWVLIAVQSPGRSFLGEVWYAEADALPGPWTPARRIVTHDDYSFYNVKQHPYFDQQGGRFVFFEGTYTATFSGASEHTPRYDYNQIMYRLDLADPRLTRR